MASKPPAMDPAHLDAMAKQLGFPDYKTWAAWNAGQRRSASIDPSKITTTGPATVAQKKPGNWLSALFNKIPPFSIIGHVSDAYGNATGTN